MSKLGKWAARTGAGLHFLIGVLLILSGIMKLAVPPTEEVTSLLTKGGIIDDIQLIAVGEILTAVLLILPWTASLGVLLTSSFWGGAILFHMTQNDSYLAQSVFLLLTWAAAFLRLPAMFSSFSPDRARNA